MRYMRYATALALGAFLAAPSPAAQGQTCDLAFTVEIVQGVGPIAPGTRLEGGAAFTTDGRSFRQDGGATGRSGRWPSTRRFPGLQRS